MPIDARGVAFSLSEVLERVVAHLRTVEPELAAVLLGGSFARNEADAWSDVDILALTVGRPQREYHVLLLDTDAKRPVHVSVEAGQMAPPGQQEPANWALGFAVRDEQCYVWCTPAAQQILGPDPSLDLPAAPPELEDFVECYMKVRRGAALGHVVQLRWAARLLAEYSPALLAEFNPGIVVRSPVGALNAALSLPRAPEHYREDFAICAGLTSVGEQEIAHAARRLALGIVAYLRKHGDGRVTDSPDLAEALYSGALERYLRHSEDLQYECERPIGGTG